MSHDGNDIASVLSSTSLRRAQLQARCEAQRNELSEQVADIEQRLHGTDAVLGRIRNVFKKPSIIAGGLALLMGASGAGWWSKLSKAAVMFSTARRIYSAFKQR